MLEQLKKIIHEIAEDPTVWTLNRFETEARLAQTLIDAGLSSESVWGSEGVNTKNPIAGVIIGSQVSVQGHKYRVAAADMNTKKLILMPVDKTRNPPPPPPDTSIGLSW